MHIPNMQLVNIQDLDSLIIYCRTKRINPWKWEEQKKTTVCDMFSFNESTAVSRCKDPKGKYS